MYNEIETRLTEIENTEIEEEQELVSPKTDIVFKELFCKNTKALASFISSVTGKKIEATDIIIMPNEITSEDYDSKASRLDIEALINNEKYDIEMQVCREKGLYKRSRYYWAKLYIDNFKKGNKYNSLKPTICINIVDFVCFDKPEFLSRYQSVDTLGTKGSKYYECKDIMNLDTTYYIELPKLKNCQSETNLELWAKFFQVRKESDLAMLENKNKDLFCDVTDNLRAISQDEVKRKAAFRRERAIADYINRYDDGLEDGIAQEKIKNILASYNEGVNTSLIARIFKMSVAEVEEIINSNEKVTSNEG